MERQTNELLFLLLLAILATSIALIYWFDGRGKRKSSHSPHPIPLWRRWRPSDPSPFSGFTVHIDDIVAEGGKVFSRGRFSGTHTGVFNGIPATGKSFSAGFIDEWLIKDGKLGENWVQMDMFSLLQQLGAIPAA